MIWFVCPDSDEPSGGIRVLYRHVDHLVAAGVPAAVVHERPGFRPTWFESDTPVACADEVDARAGIDLLVVPEVYGPAVAHIGPGIAKAVFNQNAYNTFKGYAVGGGPTAYVHPDVIAAVAVSDDNAAYLRHAFPGLDVRRTVNQVDPALFHPREPKRRRVAWMPRKNASEGTQVLHLLEARGVLDGWEVVPLHGLGEAALAAELRTCAVFLATGYPEGCPTPPKEAMACGAVVVGYHGMGGRDFFDQSTGLPVAQGDVVHFAQTAEHVLRWSDGERTAFGLRASELIGERYSPEAEQRSVVEVWSALHARAGASLASTA